jgi:hypothetical protein
MASLQSLSRNSAAGTTSTPPSRRRDSRSLPPRSGAARNAAAVLIAREECPAQRRRDGLSGARARLAAVTGVAIHWYLLAQGRVDSARGTFRRAHVGVTVRRRRRGQARASNHTISGVRVARFIRFADRCAQRRARVFVGGARQELTQVLRVTPRHGDDLRADRHELAACLLPRASASGADGERDLIARSPVVSRSGEDNACDDDTEMAEALENGQAALPSRSTKIVRARARSFPSDFHRAARIDAQRWVVLQTMSRARTPRPLPRGNPPCRETASSDKSSRVAISRHGRVRTTSHRRAHRPPRAHAREIRSGPILASTGGSILASVEALWAVGHLFVA